jgi:predicted DNA-binding transcriptional regulator AlpA
MEREMPQEDVQERWITEAEASQVTGMSLSWLRQARAKGQGIPACKLSKAVRYRLSDIHMFMERHTARPQGCVQ